MVLSDQAGAGATLRWMEIAEGLRSAEVTLLHGLALVRGIDPDLSAVEAILLSEPETEELLSMIEALSDRVERLRLLAEQARIGEIEIRLRTLQLEAEAALSVGVADPGRASTLARCLPARSGFQALASALRCTDAHESWESMTIGNLLSRFRDSDTSLVRHVTGLATLSPDACWSQCHREQLRGLAFVLERHAAATRRPS
jgi:hypothetical protein